MMRTRPPADPREFYILVVIAIALLLWWWRKPPHWRDLNREDWPRGWGYRRQISLNDLLIVACLAILVLFWYWLKTTPWGAWLTAWG